MPSQARAQGAKDWFDAITVSGQVEGGIDANPARPADGNNFGRLIGDRATQALLDQITITIAKTVDQTSSSYQAGFLLRGLYGADARYYNIAGISDRALTGRNQVMPAQAHLDLHLPWLIRHGLDMQAGILAAPMGVETLDPAMRPFYTLAYTTEYSTPFEHVGAMVQFHATDRWDILFGVDTGNQVSFGRGDDNDAAAGYFGLAGNGLAGGRLSLLYLSRVGPEDAVRALGPRANGAQRFWNDLDMTFKVDDRLSLTGEFNAMHDEGLRADTVSFVGFLGYRLTPTLTVNYRGEIYRDNTGQFVTSFLGDAAYMRALLGEPAATRTAPPTTYGALTLGVTWHPTLGRPFKLFEIRPEIRFDRSLNGTTPFNGLRNAGMFAFGGDALLGF
ncbi:outer membrane beta-barrel protein [Nguyenibacter vanlangensis]|uniref:Outer membrane beta-barrel protein n=1 Tax=Nguyenibacter vanlangensis TaxID=1216886 RepID=A0ABZ3DB14_9PROT